MRVLAVIQARMASSRLPGKVLLPLGHETVLGRVVRAVRACGGVDEVVVATTQEPLDEAVVDECARLGVACHRGSSEDVLGRFVNVLATHPADAVLRVTADCPLLDPAILRTAVQVYRALPHLDYVSTALMRSLPRGTDAEVVSSAALGNVERLATGYHRSHVTSYVYEHPEQYDILGLCFSPSFADMRVTLDTSADWALVQRVVGAFGEELPSVGELGQWLRRHRAVAALNASVRQKALEEG